jgi:hypothetical protein
MKLGSAAIEKAQLLNPDLIIMDLLSKFCGTH